MPVLTPPPMPSVLSELLLSDDDPVTITGMLVSGALALPPYTVAKVVPVAQYEPIVVSENVVGHVDVIAVDDVTQMQEIDFANGLEVVAGPSVSVEISNCPPLLLPSEPILDWAGAITITNSGIITDTVTIDAEAIDLSGFDHVGTIKIDDGVTSSIDLSMLSSHITVDAASTFTGQIGVSNLELLTSPVSTADAGITTVVTIENTGASATIEFLGEIASTITLDSSGTIEFLGSDTTYTVVDGGITLANSKSLSVAGQIADASYTLSFNGIDGSAVSDLVTPVITPISFDGPEVIEVLSNDPGTLDNFEALAHQGIVSFDDAMVATDDSSTVIATSDHDFAVELVGVFNLDETDFNWG